MLEIKGISKTYKTGDLIQVALNDVCLTFRENEFVSILGPSGSGKTTLLNIIGGLDQYDTGDLIINNVSTKKYKDRDWDSYRNHTVGFVFQSYNLIPHQTILSNVELALTISGISKKERKRRALEALDKVGLKDQAHKKPNQMSGGQMQRVAIARALVNDPDILLADEPTGALDTHTSVQVMELLKEVAKDRLVVMVTHNPELASDYSTRIVKLKDGKVTDDSNPYEVDEKKKKKAVHKNLGKSSMSMMTAFSLSLNNLLTKKGRTILTAFAGSIGIIGIAMILSLSTGFQNYVDKIQEDTLTSYPLTIQSETADATSMMLSMVEQDKNTVKEGENVTEQQNISTMFGSVGKNDLKSFKYYLQDNKKRVDELVSLTRYSYSVTPMIYTKTANKELLKLNPSDFLSKLMGSSSSLMGSAITIFSEIVDDEKMLNEQFEIVKGRMPEKYDEIILILPDKHKISDLLLYGIGLRDLSELEEMLSKIMLGEKVENESEPMKFTYDDLLNLEFRLVDPSSLYKFNKKYNIYENMSEDKAHMNKVYENATKLKVVGLVVPKGNSLSMSSGVGYTRALTEHIISVASESEIVKKQLADKNKNVFTGKDFDDDSKDAGLDFQDMISIDEDMLSSAFGMKISEKDIEKMTKGYMTEISNAIKVDTSKAQTAFLNGLSSIMKNILNDYYNENQVSGMAMIKLSEVPSIVSDGLKSKANKKILSDLESSYVIPADTFATMYNPIITGMLQQYVAMMGASQTPPTTPPTTPPVEENEENNTVLSTNSTTGGMTDLSAPLVGGTIDTIVDGMVAQEQIIKATEEIAAGMTEANMNKVILTKVGELTQKLMTTIAGSFNVDSSKIAAAFKFDMTEEEMRRIFETMMTATVENADTNLISLNYQNLDEPTTISFYFKDFDSKEQFIEFLDNYNENAEEEKVIAYTDITGILMSSVKTIVDSVSYVLIAFVSISLVVSSIMIGIITYISVLERTKEIGVLRAIGASKKNISSIFNAETFIVGLFSGLLGIATTLVLLIPTNMIIHSVNTDINAVLPVTGAVVLVILSVILTLIGGLIPSKQAAKKDPVLALRTE